jgi:hypothetical protein
VIQIFVKPGLEGALILIDPMLGSILINDGRIPPSD